MRTTTSCVPFGFPLNDDMGRAEVSRDLTSKSLFWSVLLVSAFENNAGHDGDPDGTPNGPLSWPVPVSQDSFDFGYAGAGSAIWLDQNHVAVFLETIRDAAATQANFEHYVVAHEIGHTIGSGRLHQTTGILREAGFASANYVFYDPETLSLIRNLSKW